MKFKETLNLLKKLLSSNEELSKNIYLVGGCVRDLIIGQEPKDIDICIDIPNGIQVLSEWLKKNHEDKVSGFVDFPRYGTMRFILHLNSGDTSEIDCVIPRSETYNLGPRKPDQIIQTTIKEDALRRDFCCNALYQRLYNDEIIDPTGNGLRDCRNRVLSVPLDPKKTFTDDPLRMLRAIRFFCTKEFKIDEGNLEGIKPYPEYFKLSMERVRDEFEKILMSNKAIEGIKLLHSKGLLKKIIPELEEAWGFDQQSKYHSLNLSDHLFSVLTFIMNSKYSDNIRLRWAGLLHDISKYKYYTYTDDNTSKHFKMHEIYSSTMSEKILYRLKYSNSIVSDVKILVKNHMRLKQQYDYKTEKYTGTDKSIRKFINNLGSLYDLELELINADNMSHASSYNMPKQVTDLRNRIKNLNIDQETSSLDNLSSKITGNDIMDFFNINPGIVVREIKLILQDYLEEDPKLEKQELIDKYLSEFQGTFIIKLEEKSDNIIAFAILEDTSITFNAKDYFGNELPKDRIFQVTGTRYPMIYKKLIKEKIVKDLINKISNDIYQISKLDDFKGIKITLEDGDFSASVIWNDNTVTEII